MHSNFAMRNKIGLLSAIDSDCLQAGSTDDMNI